MKWLIAILCAVALVGVGVTAVPSFIDWDRYSEDFADQLRAATGRDLTLTGDVGMQLVPAPKMTVRNAVLEIAPSSEKLTVAEMVLELHPASLLTGGIAVKSIALNDPVLQIDAQSLEDWLRNGTPVQAGPDAQQAVPSDALGQFADKVTINNGRIVAIADNREAAVIAERITVSGSAASAKGPYQAKGEIALYGQPLEIAIATGLYRPDTPTALRIGLKDPNRSGETVISGELQVEDGRINTFSGKISGRMVLASANASTGSEAPASEILDVRLDSRLQVALNMPATIRLDEMTLALGAARGSGHLSYTVSETPEVEVDFRLNRMPEAWTGALVRQLDLGSVFDSMDASAGGSPASAQAGVSQLAQLFSLVPAKLPDIVGRAQLAVDSMEFPNGYIRQIQSAATFGAGTINIDRFSALFPGSSALQMDGLWTADGGPPRFNGGIKATSDNLRGFLTWLGMDTSRVRAGRLTNLSFNSDLSVNDGLLQLSRIDLQLDRTAFTGGLALFLEGLVSRRPSFGISVTGDKFNLDGYMPLADRTAASSPSSARDARPAWQQMLGWDDGFNAEAIASRATVLNRFDANLLVNIGELTYAGTPVRGLHLDLSLVNGGLDLRQLTVAEFEGASLTVNGKGREFADTPHIELAIDLETQDLGRLLGDTDYADARALKGLGQTAFKGQIQGGFDKLRLDGLVNVTGMEATVDAAISDLTGDTDIDVSLEGRHPHFAGLLFALGLEVDAERSGIESLEASLDLNRQAGRTQIAFEGQLQDGVISATGLLDTTGAGPSVDAKVHIRHQSLAQLLDGSGLAPGNAINDNIPVNLTVAATGAPDLVTFNIFDVIVASSKFTLTNGTLQLDGPRPALAGDITADPIVLDILFRNNPREALTSELTAGLPQDTSVWSRRPFDWSLVTAFDADLTFEAGLIQYGLYVLAAPKGHILLDGGTLKISDFTGRLFNGDVTLNGGMSLGNLPAINGDIAFSNADLGLAMLALVSRDQLFGTGDVDVTFNTFGNSPFDLVNGIIGEIRVAAKEGTLRDLQTDVFTDLFGPNSADGELAHRLAGLFSGETAFTALESVWRLNGGVAETRDSIIAFPESRLQTTGSVDLRTGELDLTSSLTVDDNAAASEKLPPLRIFNQGTLASPERRVDAAAVRQYLFNLRRTRKREREGVPAAESPRDAAQVVE